MFMTGVVLDRESIKALSSDTRTEILKYLGQRRMTLSEISERLGMSLSSVKEHLDNLVSSGLIEKMDEGRKWKYYKLTGKGRNIVSPVDMRVSIVLVISAVAIFASAFLLVNNPTLSQYRALEMAAVPGNLLYTGEAIIAPEAALVIEIVVLSLSVITLVLCLGYLIAKGRISLRR